MNILGLQKLTLLDYPGKLAAIIFLGGCNFRCPFCQNSSLVLAPHTLPPITPEEFSNFLKKRSGILDGICVTGGEPTLHANLPDLFRQIKDAGYLAKLDTNGTNPEMLEYLINEKLVDYVAMDIKAGPSNYANVCGLIPSSPANTLSAADTAPAIMLPAHSAHLLDQVQKSVNILLNSSIEYEFRTTLVKGLHTEDDITEISSWIAGCRAWYLQSFRDCPEVLLENHSFSAFSDAEMQQFLTKAQQKIPHTSIRG